MESDRLNKSEINNQYEGILNADFINNIFNSLPHVAAVLNNERQIIFANQKLINDLGMKTIKDALGARPGELLRCEHSHTRNTGCGTTEQCRYCEALNVMLTSQRENRRIESECTIVSEIDGAAINFEFGIVVNPFEFKENRYFILSLYDISDTKRRIALERIFFHDVINKIGSLNGFLELIKAVNNPSKMNEYIDELDIIGKQLTKEIIWQKQLLEAENGTLAVNYELIQSDKFLQSLIAQISEHKVAGTVQVKISENSESFNLYSDSALLGRVIFNMLKNAVEATDNYGVVEAECKKQEDKIIFKVRNPVYISEDVQSQIFKKSFSTKDIGRGLGTYSMKLLTEQYLKGKIHFHSTKEEGTIFFLELNSIN